MIAFSVGSEYIGHIVIYASDEIGALQKYLKEQGGCDHCGRVLGNETRCGDCDDLEVLRQPLFDAYQEKEIPLEIYRKAGWAYSCASCAEMVDAYDWEVASPKGQKAVAFCPCCYEDFMWSGVIIDGGSNSIGLLDELNHGSNVDNVGG